LKDAVVGLMFLPAAACASWDALPWLSSSSYSYCPAIPHITTVNTDLLRRTELAATVKWKRPIPGANPNADAVTYQVKGLGFRVKDW